MKRASTLALLLAAAGALGMAAPARAQVTTTPPIRVKTKTPSNNQSRFQGEVIHADAIAIIVRDRKDPRFIRTFTYSPKVKEQMEQILASGGYQFGDRVVIRYENGKDEALAISGRPSKPL
jgi:hypothetical protein